MRKIIFYLILFFFSYLVVCFIKNTWDKDEMSCKSFFELDLWCSENVVFTVVKEGDFTPGFPYGRYEIKATSDNPDYGIFYIDGDDPTLPDNIELNKVYKVEINILQAHSWKDFFLLGTCYDVEVYRFLSSLN